MVARAWVLCLLFVAPSLSACGSQQTRRSAEYESHSERRAHERRPSLTVSSDPPAAAPAPEDVRRELERPRRW